ncbi:MAG TPA: GAF domain-containing protein, partial [Sphingomicrobium sp.]|nr:GAF domain-containing protein [Sphingomicrobium sp.]
MESDKARKGFTLDASSPTAAAPLESILCTEELRRRPSRPSDYEAENRALVALVGALADSPRTILQTLADRVLAILQADSAGLSLLTKDKRRFYWAAIAGAWRPHSGGGTPRDFGPCGDVLDRNTPMLFTHWERRYPYLSTAVPLADEGLLAPFYVNGEAVGTIWAIAHSNRRKFDAEDLRLLESMSRFASAAHQTVEAIENLSLEIDAREKAKIELRTLTDGLETQVQVRTQELQRSEAFLAEGQRLSATGSFSWRVATDEITWSEQTYSIFEFDQAVPVTFALIGTRIHPEDVPLFHEMIDRARRDGSDFEYEQRLQMPDHSVKYLHV